jgi:hypothetical protein
LPTDAGKITALSTQFSTLSGIDSALLWITEYGIFPSCQNLPLFYGYRAHLGDTRSVIEAPGHLFESSELEYLSGILNLCLIFFWSCLVADSTAETVISFSHDEYCVVRARDHARFEKISEAFSSFGLNELKSAES